MRTRPTLARPGNSSSTDEIFRLVEQLFHVVHSDIDPAPNTVHRTVSSFPVKIQEQIKENETVI